MRRFSETIAVSCLISFIYYYWIAVVGTKFGKFAGTCAAAYSIINDIAGNGSGRQE